MFFNLFKKQPEPPEEPSRGPRDASVSPEGAPAERPSTEPQPEPQAPRGPIPAGLRPGMTLKLVPARQPGAPRVWPATILRWDREGIWITREKGPDAYLAATGDVMTLLTTEGQQRFTYDCPVVRVEVTVGNNRPDEVLVAPPAQPARDLTTPTHRNNRRHLRIPASLPGEFREVQQGLLGPAITLHTVDVSLSGLAFQARREVEVGGEIEIRLLAWKFPLQVRARVVRSHSLADGDYFMAVSFPSQLSSITRELISQFILDNQRR